MTEGSYTNTSADLWLLEQIQFCLQHNLNASLQTNPCMEWVIAGKSGRYLTRDIPECVSRNYGFSSSFRHRNLADDDELVQQCVLLGEPVAELLWMTAWQACSKPLEGLGDSAGRLLIMPPDALLERYPGLQPMVDLMRRQPMAAAELARKTAVPESIARRFVESARCAGALA
ncbi:hypothetical protein [Oceanobacter mangrovi]|uniref:hypothetical protein n=1 Tax=Oceanobacter mangrovi TaxID=2862510 RepID=UPI001C8EF1DC|nr:hypothetical protein [Oceanobacter mangrovi]